mgnify:CR=1 FL=1|tara:strand:+ start:251 stop:373 length:123 start_codon:yes stop_codon:yes gene_type:complete
MEKNESKYFIVQVQPEIADEIWYKVRKLNGVLDVWEKDMR